jgi:hypothetical protein
MKKPLRAAFVVTLSTLAMGAQAPTPTEEIHTNPPPRPRLGPDGGPAGPSILPVTNPPPMDPAYAKPVTAPDVPGAAAQKPLGTVHRNPPPRPRPDRTPDAGAPVPTPPSRMMELPDPGPAPKPARTSTQAKDPEATGPMTQPAPAGTPDPPPPEGAVRPPPPKPAPHIYRNPPRPRHLADGGED